MKKRLNKLIDLFVNQVKKDWKELKEIVHDDKKAFRLNRFLSNNISVAIITIAIDLLFVLLLNYIVNVVSHSKEMVQDTKNILSYVGISNIGLPILALKNHKFVRTLYKLYAVVLCILDGSFIYKIRTSFSEKYFNLDQKGDSRWATLEEIKAQYLEIDETGTEYDGMPGFPISRYGDKLYLDTNMTNNLIIGITRSGKGETHVFPSIDTYSRAKIKPSLVIADMKAELYKSNQKAQTLQKRGYDVYFLNLQNPIKSMGYNPLELITKEWENENYTFAEDLTQTFVWQIFDPDSATGTEKYFAETGAHLTAGLIIAHVEDCLRKDKDVNVLRKKSFERKQELFKKLDDEAKEEARKQYDSYLMDAVLDANVQTIPDDIEFTETHEYRKMINMYSIINTYFELASIICVDAKGNPTGKNALDYYFTDRPSGDRAKMKYMSIAVAGGKTKASVYSTMNTKLTIYTLETVAKMTAESSFNIKDIGFGKKPMAIFLGIPDEDTSKYQIATTFIRQVYTILAHECWDGGTCDRPVKFVLDEFGNLPKIEGMESIITVCAGRNITFDLYIQSYAQIDEKYGQTSKTIRSNCGNTIFIRTLDPATTEEFSKMVGSDTNVNIQRNGSKLSLHKTFMETNEDKPLISPVQLGRLMKGEDIVVRSMKVTDNNGEDVYMAPIRNLEKNGQRLKFRYQYLEQYFPSPQNISLDEVLQESRAYINLKQRTWDYQISQKYLEDDKRKSNSPLTVGEIELVYRNKLIEVLEKILSDEQKDVYEDLLLMPLYVAENIISAETDTAKLDVYTRNALLQLINHYLEREEE